LLVSGARDHDRCVAKLESARRPADRLRFKLLAFEENMEQLYASTTMAVCRAGAVTVAELAATGTPSALVPLPGAPHDHQTRNAQTLVDAEAAVLINDAELDGDRLADELDGLLADASRLSAMAAAAHGLARPDAAARVADLVEEAARAA
jgi:UDP-N-acetylglucosamine:LPS N-acetylglucosamine transferase